MKKINWMNHIAFATLLAAAAGLQGCTNLSSSADVYTAGQAQREQSVRMGTVESVRPVKIQVDNVQPGGLGLVGGGALGAVAGSTIGGGRGSLLSGIAGGVTGAAAGHAIEGAVQGRLKVRDGVEITVRLDNGALRAVTQEVTQEVFRVGERVRLLTANGITRVTH